MDENILEQLRQIKTEFRLGMNGVASTSMREKGLAYKVNFGIELPRLRDIASSFTPSRELAQALWQENVRESRILATMLMPIEEMSYDLADVWVGQIPTQEIAEIFVMNLLSRAPYASEMGLRYLASDNEIYVITGLLILTRLTMGGAEFNDSAEREMTDQAVCLLQDENQRIARQSFILLSRYADRGLAQRRMVISYLPASNERMSEQLKGWLMSLRG